MAEVKGHSEPTMEEILASIRRIIAEDDGPQSMPSRAAGIMPEAADTTVRGSAAAAEGAALADAHAIRVAGTEPPTREVPPVLPGVVPPQPTPVPPVQEAILDLTERIDHDDRPVSRAIGMAPNGAPPLGRINRPPPLKNQSESSASETARRSASFTSSVATLTRIAGMNQSAREPELPLGNAGRTLEDMVRELLRPHLKEWLDAHLPRLVERMVRDEINRLVRDAQER
jgi:hypothetical protein